METDVIIVGAGPVGLMLAGELRLGGADVVMYDKLPAPTGESRALGFNRRAAESLAQRGLLTRLGQVHWGAVGHFGGVPIELGPRDIEHSGVLGLPQSRTEEVLTAWLTELGVPIWRGHELVGLRHTSDRVTASLATPRGPVETSASWLVGCDGGHSTVRTLAGIAAPGPASTRGMYTAEIVGGDPRPRFLGERAPGGSMVVSVPVGGDRHRIVIHDAELPPEPDPANLTFDRIATAWLRLTGEDISGAHAPWVWACGNAAGLAQTYRSGRVLLAGDAAHEMPPLAAWGLSAGLLDAVNLGWKLAATVTGRAPDGLLDTYDTERRPYGARLIRDAQAVTTIFLGDDDLDPVRDVLAEMVADPEAGELLVGSVSGLGVRYDTGPGTHPLLGRRLPPTLEVTHPDGHRTRVATLLAPARGILLTVDPARYPAARDWADRVDLVAGTAAAGWPADLPAAGTATTAEPGTGFFAALVRPDGYVAWTDPGAEHTLTEALARWFGSPNPAGERGSVGAPPEPSAPSKTP